MVSESSIWHGFRYIICLGTYVARSKAPNKKWLLAVRMVWEYLLRCRSASESPKMIVQIAPTTRSYLFFDETAAFQLHHHWSWKKCWLLWRAEAIVEKMLQPQLKPETISLKEKHENGDIQHTEFECAQWDTNITFKAKAPKTSRS